MPEERGMLIGDRIESELRALREDVGSLKEDVAELKGEVRQMDRRVSNLEQLQRWTLGIMITSWMTLVGLSVTILTKLR